MEGGRREEEKRGDRRTESWRGRGVAGTGEEEREREREMPKRKQLPIICFKFLSTSWDPDNGKQTSRYPENASQCNQP